MTGTPLNSPDQSMGAWIDSQCDQFESAWKNGDPPSIADFMNEVAGDSQDSNDVAPSSDLQATLFHELLLIDLAYRKRWGYPHSHEVYGEWPEFAAMVDDAIRAADAPKKLGKLAGDNSEETVYQSPEDQVQNSAPNSLTADAPRRLGDYELLDELGRGGMGVVYRARHRKLDRLVALKTTRSGPWIGKNELKRFEREARAAANLEHPGIVPVYEVGEDNGIHYLAMPIARQSLAAMIQTRPLDPQDAADMGLQLAQAVAAAHKAGIIHRDLKPHNILLSKDGRPQVADFGLAKPAFQTEGSESEDVDHLTRTGQVVGTPNYMPPEQAKGQDVDERADIYSLGATFYAMLTARAPFEAPDPVTVLSQVIEAEPAPLRQWQPGVPKDLEAICLTCLEKRPERRYQSMTEVVADIQRFLAGEKVQALRRMEQARRRRQQTAAGILFATLVLLFLPQLMTLGPGRHFWLSRLSQETQLEIHAQSLRASWWGPVRFQGLVIRTSHGDKVVEARTLEVERSLWSMWRGASHRGRLRWDQPDVTFSRDSWVDVQASLSSADYDQGLLGFLLGSSRSDPWQLQVERMSCTLEPPNESSQVIIRDWSTSLDLRYDDGRPTLNSTSPVTLELYVTPAICSGLKYVLPMLAGATSATGTATVELDSCRLPLKDFRESQAAGHLTMHFEAMAPGLLLGEVISTDELAWKIELHDLAPIQCEVRDGRVYHRRAEYVLVEPLVAAVETRGSVGWDDSLEIEMNIELPDEWIQDRPMLASLASTDIPVGGTLDLPSMDWNTSSAISGASNVIAGIVDAWQQREPKSRLELLQRFRGRLQRSKNSDAPNDVEPIGAQFLPPLESLPGEANGELEPPAEEEATESNRRRKSRRPDKKGRLFGRGKNRE